MLGLLIGPVARAHAAASASSSGVQPNWIAPNIHVDRPAYVIEASRIKNPPHYSRENLKHGEEVTVTLHIYVGTSGEPIRIISHVDSAKVPATEATLLNAAAMRAASKWQFVAAWAHGKAVASWLSIPVTFQG
ncbi:MAG: TonB family protein [Xanthomonadaceae bacterium]|nr:TonB family protein [Xanthomonadaceae bacterium]